jgi:hypothetical protein
MPGVFGHGWTPAIRELVVTPSPSGRTKAPPDLEELLSYPLN